MSGDDPNSNDQAATSTTVDEASSSLTTLNALVEEAKGQKTNLDGQIAAATTSIENFIAKVKADLSEIDASKTTVATIKGAVDEMQRATSTDVSAITQSKLDIDKLKSEAGVLSKKVAADYEDVANKITSLQEQQLALKTILGDLDAIKTEARTNCDGVLADVKTVAEAKAAFEQLKSETQTAHDELVLKQTDVAAQVSEITNSNEKIKQLHVMLLSDTPERKSIKSEIDELQAKLTDVLKASELNRGAAETEFNSLKEKAASEFGGLVTAEETRFNKLYEILQGQILSLLPSAGSAGLASTYYDAKSKYAVTAFHRPIGEDGSRKDASGWRNLVGHNPTSLIATVFFYGMFLVPIGVIIWLFFDVLAKMSGAHPVNFTNQYLVFKALIAVPLGTMSLFGYSSLRLYRRLYEEYNYKQRVMELYQSFSKEIEAKGDDDQKKALLAIMLKAVADKPSLNMHKYDGINSDGGWKIDIGALLNRFVNPVKS